MGKNIARVVRVCFAADFQSALPEDKKTSLPISPNSLFLTQNASWDKAAKISLAQPHSFFSKMNEVEFM
jgi:hypothetical protein